MNGGTNYARTVRECFTEEVTPELVWGRVIVVLRQRRKRVS